MHRVSRRRRGDVGETAHLPVPPRIVGDHDLVIGSQDGRTIPVEHAAHEQVDEDRRGRMDIGRHRENGHEPPPNAQQNTCPCRRLLLVGTLDPSPGARRSLRQVEEVAVQRAKPPSSARQSDDGAPGRGYECDAQKETAGGQASGQARGPSPRFPLRSQRPEPPRLDTVTLHLEVQGLVVHLEEPSRPALVPPRGMKGQADRLSLRLGGGAGGDLLQGGPTIPRMPSRRALAVPSHRAVGHSTLATRRPVSAFPLRHRTRGHSRKRAAHGYGHASFPPPPNFPR